MVGRRAAGTSAAHRRPRHGRSPISPHRACDRHLSFRRPCRAPRDHPRGDEFMTAGRGIAHSERSPLSARQGSEGLFGIQSWIALPQAQEETDPSFQHFEAACSTGPAMILKWAIYDSRFGPGDKAMRQETPAVVAGNEAIRPSGYAALGFYSCYNRPARVIQLSCPLANNRIAIFAANDSEKHILLAIFLSLIDK